MNIRTSTAPAPILPGEPPRRSRVTVLVIILGLLAVAAGVIVVVNLTRDGGAVSTQTSATPTGPATSAPTLALDPQAATKAAVIDAYTKSYQAFIAVGKEAAPNPNDPRLSEHSTGTALLAKQQALVDHKNKGQVFVGDAELHPTVIQLGPDTATVTDCAYDRTALIESRTGVTVVGSGTGGTADTATLILEGGVWKVNHFKDEKSACVPPAT